MDPFTHGTIGLALSALSGQPVALDNPFSIGCAIGAMMPDADAVIRIFSNDMVYLKHHRGATHTAPFMAVVACVIALGLMPFFSGYSFWSIAFWAFVGGLSHTLFDSLNSYGAKLFRKKLKFNLLTLYDPVISAMALFMILDRHPGYAETVAIPVITVLYLLFRYGIRERVRREVHKLYSHGYTVERIDVLPGLKVFYKWDYIVTTKSHQLVGNYNPFTGANTLLRKLTIRPEYVELFNRTRAAAYFNNFSPNLHVRAVRNPGGVTLHISDIRYYMRNRFMHHATVTLDDDHNVVESHFHPYHPERSVRIAEQSV